MLKHGGYNRKIKCVITLPIKCIYKGENEYLFALSKSSLGLIVRLVDLEEYALLLLIRQIIHWSSRSIGRWSAGELNGWEINLKQQFQYPQQCLTVFGCETWTDRRRADY